MAQVTLTVRIWTPKGSRKRFPNDDSELSELFAPHLEHISAMCEQGYIAGEVCDEDFTGWWSVDRDA